MDDSESDLRETESVITDDLYVPNKHPKKVAREKKQPYHTREHDRKQKTEVHSKSAIDRTKNSFLNLMGFDWHSCVRVMRDDPRTLSTSWADSFHMIKFKARRLLHSCETLEEATQKMTCAIAMHHLKAEERAFVRSHNPQSFMDYIQCLEEWVGIQKEKFSYRRKWDERKWSNDRYERKFEEKRFEERRSGGQVSRQGEDSFKRQSDDQKRFRRPDITPTCFSCGKKGHKPLIAPTRRGYRQHGLCTLFRLTLLTMRYKGR